MDAGAGIGIYVYRPLCGELVGIFFLEQDKAYSTLEASGIIGVNAIAGIAGTIIAGMLSDRFFPRNRSVMAGFISLLNTAGFALMLWSPHNYYTDIRR